MLLDMYTYRVCKYNPKYRSKSGVYLKDEWTDYSDIGSEFEGKTFTEAEYLTVEQNYIVCITDILNELNIDSLQIQRLEKGNTNTWENGQRISKESLVSLIRDCLRNDCWCQLADINFYLHFGYDYYIYVGCELSTTEIEEICNRNNLYCDVRVSPYSDEI